MRVRHVSIRNFRGIKECDWHISARFVCLVGPGGSTKTTLLDALGLALSRSYRAQFTDADFYGCDTEKPIRIEVAVTELPDDLIQEKALGLDRSGIWPDGRLEHDPVEGTEECLLIRLEVDRTLEPTWQVVRPDEDEGRSVTATQRQKLAFFRVGEYVDRQLRWSQASALSALTEGGTDATAVVVDAHRQAREAAFDAMPQELHDSAAAVQKHSRELGAAPYAKLRPGLDPAGAATAHALVLHDEAIPLTGQGLGTRRLTSLSIQERAVEGGSIVAVDEIEHGLEPHRLVHVLRYLRRRAETEQLQIFLATHSPVTISALTAADLGIVMSDAGKTCVRAVPSDVDEVQGAVRSAPTALLGSRLIVAEGAAEVGLVRGLCAVWDAELSDPKLATSVTMGLAVVNGRGGAQALQRAQIFRSLGYECAALVDNDDRSIDDGVAKARASDVAILRWTPERALEDEIVVALDDEGLRDFVGLAVENRGEDSVACSVARCLGVKELTGTDPVAWIDADHDRDAIIGAIAAAAKGQKAGTDASTSEGRAWFKREDGGEQLAGLLVRHRRSLRDTDLAARLRELKAYLYVEADASSAGADSDGNRSGPR